MACLKGHGSPPGTATHRRGAIGGGDIAWVAPNYTISAEIWRDLKRACRPAYDDREWRGAKNEVEKRIAIAGGGSVKVCSADNPDSLRGPNRDGIVIDEAAFVDQYLWTHVLRPQVSATGGWWMFLTSPNGDNWIKTEFEKAFRDPSAERWQLPCYENPLLTPEEVAEMRLDMGPRGFAQEAEAQFVSTEGTEWPAHYFGDRLWFDKWPSAQIVYKLMALDPSLGENEKSDYSAIILMQLMSDGTMFVDADIARRDTTTICDDLIRLQIEFQAQAIAVETNGFQRLLAGELQRKSKAAGMMLPIWPVEHYGRKKVERIRTLTPYLSRAEIRVLRGTPGSHLLVEQLKAFPLQKVHDDGPDALAMCLELATRMLYGGGKIPEGSRIDRVTAR